MPQTAVSRLGEVVQAFVEETKQGRQVPNESVTGALLKGNAQKVEASLIPTESVELIGAMSSDLRTRLLDVISNTPTGPFTSAELPNVGRLVTMSNNLGTVKTNPDHVEVVSMTRAARIEELCAKLDEIRRLYEENGGKIQKTDEPSSGWLEDPANSPAVTIVTDAVKKAAGSAEWMAYHAGLESGIITGKARGPMSAVSIGPLIKDAHTPRERVHLASVVDELVALREIFRQISNRATETSAG